MISEINTFGDARRVILETIIALRDNKMDVSRGMAIAANFKVLNENILAEVQAGKLSLATDGKAHEFGRITRMGQRLLGNEQQ